jgi:DNA transposition AAA+ family ATPase
MKSLTIVPPAAAAAPVSGVAALRNITALSALITRTMQRAGHLPGLATFSGPSGFGKSFAAAHAAGAFRAYYVEARSGWTRKAMLLAILRQQGVVPAKTVTEMVDQVAEQLALSRRPLIIDEFDHVVARNLVELVRDIYEQSQASIILIGEEYLPQKLQRWERFHGRVLDWMQASPCSLPDAQALARLYCPNLVVADDLLTRVVAEAHGSCRRVCVNLDQINVFARGEGLETITLADWGSQPLHTGKPPATRSF